MAQEPLLRIGTRGSPLAMAQTREVRQRLLSAHPELADRIEISVIVTRGDRVLDRPLAEIGGKGLFTEEIERGLLDGALDIAVHSMKDMPTHLPDGLGLPCLLAREDVRDAFLARDVAGPDALPPGAVVGTSSLRRQAQLLHRRPDLTIVPFRGNVQTRLDKLRRGEVDATLLAMAGLNRLGLAQERQASLSTDILLPAVAQGAIGIECRLDDDRVRHWLAPLSDRDTEDAVTAERAFLAALDGSCRTPIAGWARLVAADTLLLEGLVATPDGARLYRIERRGARREAAELGRDAGLALKAEAGADLPAILA